MTNVRFPNSKASVSEQSCLKVSLIPVPIILECPRAKLNLMVKYKDNKEEI
jgi:hypothetical protein